jgi:hypothetical protein
LDVAAFLLPILVGVGLFLLGRTFRRWLWGVRGAAILLSLAVIALALLSLARVLPLAVERVAFDLGGMTTLLCLVAMFLLGVVWGVPKRSLTAPFLITLALIALVVVGIESSGRLWWRFGSPEAWSRTADEDGLLRQSSTVTCAPAAAVMLLHQYGITAGEGEMAYLSGTTVLGTDATGIARALEAKAEPHGLRVEVAQTNYDECLSHGKPFLAHVAGQYLGHAAAVVGMTPEQVFLLDPAEGKLGQLTRDEFEAQWDRVAVRLVK